MVVQIHEGVAIKKFKLDKSTLRFGRDPASDVFIDNTSEPGSGPQYYIEDLKSTNSTFVNSEKITRHKLQHNDMIRIGWNNFKFIDESKGDPNKTAKIKKSWIPGVYYTEDD